MLPGSKTNPSRRSKGQNQQNGSCSSPTCPLSFSKEKKKNLGCFLRNFCFQKYASGCCLVAQSCSQLTYSAHDISSKNAICTFSITECCVIESQKVWRLNEHSRTFAMANLLCSGLWIKCRLLQEWFEWNSLIHFHACTFNLPGSVGLEVLN